MAAKSIPVLLVIFLCGAAAGFAGREWIAQSQNAAEKRIAVQQSGANAVVNTVSGGITAAASVSAEAKASETKAASAAIIERVPYYVTVHDDAGCVVPVGFGQLHDAAASGNASALSGATGEPDGSPSGITLSTVAGTVSENYGICHETADRLTALQDWVKAQRALATGATGAQKGERP